jgi:hypothetical protein
MELEVLVLIVCSVLLLLRVAVAVVAVLLRQMAFLVVQVAVQEERAALAEL